MDLIRLVFEFDGTLILNNEFTVSSSPFAMDWPRGADLLVDTLGKRFVLDPDKHALKVSENLFIVKLLKERPLPSQLKVVSTSSFFLFPNRFTVEVGNSDTTSFFTLKSGQSKRIAFDLGALVVAPKVSMRDGRIYLESANVRFVYNIQGDRVERHTKKMFERGPLPLMFLQHVANEEFEEAQALLGFDISAEAMREYFGKFEVLLNNYLGQEDAFSVLADGRVRTFRFQVEDGKIVNLGD